MNYEGFSQPYAFQKLTKSDKFEEKYEADYAILETDEKKIGLKRIYG